MVGAPADKVLPIRTPFRLEGSGRDADGGPLTYVWEQLDIGGEDVETGPETVTPGGTSLVDNTKIDGPLFRVFGEAAEVSDEDTLVSPSPGINMAGTSPSRFFPDLAQILRGNANAKRGRCPQVAPPPEDLDLYVPVDGDVRDCYSEFLPTKRYVGTAGSTTPAMHFRLTGRDAFPNGGGVGYDEVTLRIDPKAGPFLVKSQAKRFRIRATSTRRVTWAVNRTDRLAKRVRILLSVNGGRTWRFTLARSTLNDGSHRGADPAAHDHERTNHGRRQRQLLLRRQRRDLRDHQVGRRPTCHSDPMQVGMTLPVMEPGLDAQTLEAWARTTDEGPFSSVCFGERMAFDNPETLTLLGAVAAWTERVRIVTTVIVPQLHDPVLLAKSLATGDLLSGGRLTVGLGVGGRAEDYRAVGADTAEQTMAGMAGRVAVMKRVWNGEKVTEAVRPVGPPPAQPGGPPLLVGTMGPKTIRHAAAWADGSRVSAWTSTRPRRPGCSSWPGRRGPRPGSRRRG